MTIHVHLTDLRAGDEVTLCLKVPQGGHRHDIKGFPGTILSTILSVSKKTALVKLDDGGMEYRRPFCDMYLRNARKD